MKLDKYEAINERTSITLKNMERIRLGGGRHVDIRYQNFSRVIGEYENQTADCIEDIRVCMFYSLPAINLYLVQ